MLLLSDCRCQPVPLYAAGTSRLQIFEQSSSGCQWPKIYILPLRYGNKCLKSVLTLNLASIYVQDDWLCYFLVTYVGVELTTSAVVDTLSCCRRRSESCFRFLLSISESLPVLRISVEAGRCLLMSLCGRVCFVSSFSSSHNICSLSLSTLSFLYVFYINAFFLNLFTVIKPSDPPLSSIIEA